MHTVLLREAIHKKYKRLKFGDDQEYHRSSCCHIGVVVLVKAQPVYLYIEECVDCIHFTCAVYFLWTIVNGSSKLERPITPLIQEKFVHRRSYGLRKLTPGVNMSASQMTALLATRLQASYPCFCAWDNRLVSNWCCNGCLVTSTVIRLTTQVILILYASAFLFSYNEHSHFPGFRSFLFVACTISLCNYKCSVLGKPCATHGPMCTVEVDRCCGEPCVSKRAFFLHIHRRGKPKSLLI